MNREIKFRAWSKASDWDLMQFTGMLDKNGKEIYEGDIVECAYGKAEVVFHQGCFMVKWIGVDDVYMEYLSSRNGMHARTGEDAFEVIGNIFEN
jgi:uncharacterized phage protein (TIGR01671 family)